MSLKLFQTIPQKQEEIVFLATMLVDFYLDPQSHSYLESVAERNVDR